MSTRFERMLLVVVLPLVLGCPAASGTDDEADGGAVDVPDPEAAGEIGAEEGGGSVGDAADGEDGSCPATAPNILGPFYLEGAPERSDLVETGMSGTRLTIAGAVLDSACVPIPGALLDFWQADDAGVYDNTGWRLRGRLYANSEGRWSLQTIVPGRYDTGGTFRPEHIHVRVSAPGHLLLTTQLYFPDDPFAATDPFYVPSLTMTVVDLPDGSRRATFDFVLLRPTTP